MKRQIIRLTESDLHKIIKESVKRIINERVLGQNEKFTPYTKEEGERNRKAIWSPSNPSYDAWKKQHQQGSMEEDLTPDEQNEIDNFDKIRKSIDPHFMGRTLGGRYEDENCNVTNHPYGQMGMHALSDNPEIRKFGRAYNGTFRSVKDIVHK